MESIFLFAMLAFGGALVWRRITRKSEGASSEEEAGAAVLFLLIAGAFLFIALLSLVGPLVPIDTRQPLTAALFVIGLGAPYLWALFKFMDWVTARGRRSK